MAEKKEDIMQTFRMTINIALVAVYAALIVHLVKAIRNNKDEEE